MEKAFDKNQLKQVDLATKKMVFAQYEHCLYKCDEKVSDFAASCK